MKNLLTCLILFCSSYAWSHDPAVIHENRSVMSVEITVPNFEVKNVRPGAFTDRISLNISSRKKESLQVEFIDEKGTAVLKSMINVKKGNNSIVLDHLGSLKQGAYTLTISSATGSFQEKFIKAN